MGYSRIGCLGKGLDLCQVPHSLFGKKTRVRGGCRSRQGCVLAIVALSPVLYTRRRSCIIDRGVILRQCGLPVGHRMKSSQKRRSRRDRQSSVISGLVSCVLCATALSSPASAQVATVDANIPAKISLQPGKGIIAESSDGRFSFGVRSRLQARETLSHDSQWRNESQIRTLRLFTYGHLLSKDLRYVIQFAFGANDFDPATPSPIFDAFVDYSVHRDLQLRVGQYFVVFDRARTIREFALQLVDRQQVVQELNLDRDVGVTALSSDLFGLGGKLNYAVGLYGGNGRNRSGNKRAGYLVTARLGVKPFGGFDDDSEGDLERSSKPRLALGVAGALNDNSDRQRSTIGTLYQEATFDYLHGAVDLVLKWKGLSILGEVLLRQAQVDSKTKIVSAAPVTEWSRSGWGYLVQAGYMLSPRVEVAGRWDELFKVGDTDPALVALIKRQGREVGGGINIYLNGHLLKLQADYFARFGDGSVDVSQAVRLQLDASF